MIKNKLKKNIFIEKDMNKFKKMIWMIQIIIVFWDLLIF
jgi:hypothetical protein